MLTLICGTLNSACTIPLNSLMCMTRELPSQMISGVTHCAQCSHYWHMLSLAVCSYLYKFCTSSLKIPLLNLQGYFLIRMMSVKMMGNRCKKYILILTENCCCSTQMFEMASVVFGLVFGSLAYASI